MKKQALIAQLRRRRNSITDFAGQRETAFARQGVTYHDRQTVEKAIATEVAYHAPEAEALEQAIRFLEDHYPPDAPG